MTIVQAQAIESSSLEARLKALMVMKPKPSPCPLIRIGGESDGAYLIPDDIDGIAGCFSPGVNNSKDFEDELCDRYGIPCHMCDYTSDVEKFKTPMRMGLQSFLKKWLDVNDHPDNITLDEWVKQMAPDPKEELLLQMDIEGAEYRNLLGCSDELLRRFRILVLELHDLEIANNPLKFEEELGPCLRRLEEHFTCVHAHPNNCAGEFTLEGSTLSLPSVIELTFLRKDRFALRDIGMMSPPMLPHPLDISCNTPAHPPLFLDGEWLSSSERSVESKMVMMAGKLEFCEFQIQALNADIRKAVARIETVEKQFGELERLIQAYLGIKRALKKAFRAH